MNKLTGLICISGSSESDTNILYMSGFTAPDPFIYMKTTTGGFLLVSPMEKGRAEKQCKPGTQIFTASDLNLSKAQRNKRTAQIMELMKLANVKRLKVPTDFPVGTFTELQKKKVNIQVHKNLVCPDRKIKDLDEISKIRASQQAAVHAMKAGIALISESKIDKKGQLVHSKQVLTSETVRQHIHKTLIDFDCVGIETIVAGGDQGTDPHERGHGPLFAGESIILDIFPRNEKSGYWGDITRTVCRGPAKPELKRLYNAVKAAQAAALRMVKPGQCADLAHQAAKDVFEQRGYETKIVEGKHVGFIHGTGHGVGLDIHEWPRVGASGEILEAGNIITVEPGLYYPGLGGVRIEDTIRVTDKGWSYLASCEKKFELL